MNEENKASDFIINEEERPNNNVLSNGEGGQSQRSILDILKTKTGQGSIDSYIDSPLNFNKSEGLAQMLRGATGFLGALDYAILDICIGAMKFFKEFRTPTEETNV